MIYRAHLDVFLLGVVLREVVWLKVVKRNLSFGMKLLDLILNRILVIILRMEHASIISLSKVAIIF